ncbi:unnamed protein product (macronuclear) [Paramecium tetraurelia]|uniref:Uncharacterized protein n=1 Tax=Paramecium tetraurelia TaxID=5888 RepID=A0C0H3_PARTE|nr:uncharacterized protein GSPATT00006143001 [Paramecium tetraurelia]CAK64290.1 unnamed protein product [Paramecium tetraurelia]|eukprot:XP_001431688.1 hypothetical protein (macronuclear) [Paramecium tetraurelia strain d4-2]
MFKIKRLQNSFEKKLLQFFINWKKSTQNFKYWKSNLSFMYKCNFGFFRQYSYDKDQEETRNLLVQQELQILQSICKFKMLNHNKCDQEDQQRNYSILQSQVQQFTTLVLQGELRDKINFNNRRSELLMEIYSALEEVQASSNMIFLEYKFQQLEILGLVKGQLSNQYIDQICKLYHHKEFLFALEQTYNEMLKQRIFNSNFQKIAKCLYIIQPNCQLYEIIRDLNEKSDDEQIEKTFHLKAIEIAIKEEYQHSLKFHLEQCLYHSWSQEQKDLLIESCLKLSKQFQERDQLYQVLQDMKQW